MSPRLRWLHALLVGVVIVVLGVARRAEAHVAEIAVTEVTRLTLGCHLGSTSIVIDRETGERVESVTYTAYGRSESDVRPDRYKGLREDVRFTGNEDDVEVGLTAFAKRYYAPALGRWASPDPLAVHAPGDADLNLYAYVHGRVYAATDPLGLELACAALGTCPAPAVPSAASVKSFVTTAAKVGLGIAICARFPSACGWLAAGRLATEGYDHDSAGRVLAEEALNLAGARFATRGKPGAPSQAIVEKELAATAPAAPAAPLGEAAGGVGAAEREATDFLGSRGAPLANAPYQPLRNADAVIGGRTFGGHALDQMQNRGLMPSVVENAIQTGVRSPDPIVGRFRSFDAVNNVTVITEGERVVTVIPGRLR